MRKFLGNAFSLNMIAVEDITLVRIKIIQAGEIPADVKSVVGHSDTAAVLSSILGFEVPFNRETLTLGYDDILYVAQYKGQRLPEGATELPEGATIDFLEVTIDRGCKGCPGGSCENCKTINWTHGA